MSSIAMHAMPCLSFSRPKPALFAAATLLYFAVARTTSDVEPTPAFATAARAARTTATAVTIATRLFLPFIGTPWSIDAVDGRSTPGKQHGRPLPMLARGATGVGARRRAEPRHGGPRRPAS